MVTNNELSNRLAANIIETKRKMNNWMLNQEHKHYGKVVMCRTIEGEPYRFFEKDGDISMIPLSCLTSEAKT